MSGKQKTKDNPRGPKAKTDSGERHREALERFVQFWGDMASRWGINRTMAQIHALLYASEEPLDTDQIMDRLAVSRGNANMNLRSLLEWDLVYKVHAPGSRKDFFVAEKDVWEITRRIVRQREQRELKPVRAQLEELRALLSDDNPLTAERVLSERIDNLIHLMDVFQGFSGALLPLLRNPDAALLRKLIGFAAMLRGDDGDRTA